MSIRPVSNLDVKLILFKHRKSFIKHVMGTFSGKGLKILEHPNEFINKTILSKSLG